MDSRKIVFQETRIVALGVAICTAAMIAVFALLGYFDISVLPAFPGTRRPFPYAQ